MKNILPTSLFIFAFCFNIQSQISGKTSSFYIEGCWSMISVNGEVPFKTTDGNGNFTLPLTKANNNIFILNSISIQINNIPNSKKINMGEIILPSRKSISTKEYENLSIEEKKHCIPINCWSQLLGYEYTNQLSQPCIKFKCNQIENEICDFIFDIKDQKVIIEWSKVKTCQN